MSSAKLALAAGLAAIALSACGSTAKPLAGSQAAVIKNQKGVDDPRTTHVECLRSEHIPVQVFGRVWMQIGTKPTGPTVQFEATPGAAQNAQITGQMTSAEVIGSALVYPNRADDALMQKVENCMSKGVSG